MSRSAQAFASPIPLSLIRLSFHPSTSSVSPPNLPRHTYPPPYPRRTRVTSLDLIPPHTPPTPPTPPFSFSPSSSALQQAIRAVAIGKFGSKPVPLLLIPPLRAEILRAAQSPPTPAHLALHLQCASFLGALFVKPDLAPHERDLLAFARASTPQGVLAAADAGGAAAGTPLAQFALRLLEGERLSVQEAHALGTVLYAEEGGGVGTRPVKALIAHVMRVRHESAEELAGLAKAAKGTLREGWGEGTAKGKGGVYVLVAEPFDGTVTWDLLTPLLCRHLQNAYGVRAVMNVGESSGPKYGPNLLEVCRALGVWSARSGAEVEERGGEYGVMVEQTASSAGLAEWVGVRRTIVKRPSMATTEKYVDACPGGARLFIASAFHGNYVEKMATAAEAVGFPAYVIVGRGMEGTVGVGIGERRTAQLLTGWKGKEGGAYVREMVEYNAGKEGERVVPGEEPTKGEADAERTAQRIRECGRGTDVVFEARVRATMAAFDKAIDRVQQAAPHVLQA